MRERKSISARRTAAASGRKTTGRTKHDYFEELMELVVEAANSRVLPDFLRGFAERAVKMLDAEWAGVGEIVGSRVEIYARPSEFPTPECSTGAGTADPGSATQWAPGRRLPVRPR